MPDQGPDVGGETDGVRSASERTGQEPDRSRYAHLRDRRTRWFRDGGGTPTGAADVGDEAVIAELRKLENPEDSWLRGIALLGVSIVLFASLGWLDSPLPDIAILIGVILVHELGHYVGMRLSGYRNVRMFFIPMFGAAVSGENLKAPGYKKAIVTLLGPVPGILIGAVIFFMFPRSPSRLPGQVAMTFIILNGLNLLPLYPLDGGRFFEEVLFCRNRYVAAVFKVVTGALIVLIGIALKSWVFSTVGVFVVLTVVHSLKVSGLARRMREELGRPDESSLLDLPPEAIGRLLSSVKRAFPSFNKPKPLAGLVRSVWEKLHARPPRIAATALLLVAYFAAFVAPFGIGALAATVVRPGLWDERMAAAGRAYTERRYGDAEREASAALRIAEERGRDDLRVAGSLHVLAKAYDAQARYEEAMSLLSRALEIYEGSTWNRKVDVANALTSKAMVHYHVAGFDEAETLLDRAAKVQAGAAGPRVIPVYRALIHRRQGRHASAESILRGELARDIWALGEDHAVVCVERYYLALVCADLGRLDEAEDLLMEAILVAREQWGTADARLGSMLTDLASLQVDRGGYEKARRLCELSIAIVRSAYRAGHPRVAEARFVLARLHRVSGREAEAEALLLQVLASVEKARGPDHPDVADVLCELARISLNRRLYEEAREASRLARAIVERASKEVHPRTPDILTVLALACSGLGHTDEANRLFSDAVAMYESSFPRKRRRLAEALDAYALHLRGGGWLADARAAEARAEAVRASLDGGAQESPGQSGGRAEPGAPEPDYYDGKIEEATRGLKEDPGNAYKHYLGRAYGYKKKGRYAEALKDESKAIESYHQNPKAYSARATTWWDMGEFEEAIADTTKVIELKGGRWYHDYFRRGRMYYDKGDFDAAIRNFNAAIILAGTSAASYKNRGLCYQRKGDRGRALADFNKAVEVEPDEHGAHKHRAELHAEMGRLDLALADHDAFFADPCCKGCQHGPRGRFYLYYVGDPVAAAADFRAWTRAAPDNPTAGLWLYVALHAGGRDGTVELKRRARVRDGDPWAVPLMELFLGKTSPEECLLSAGGNSRRRKAERTCQALFFMGKWHAMQGNAEEAGVFFRRCIEAGPHYMAESDAAAHELRLLER
jgi:tetratricopeptide (TPR) repeat protein/Zn-dependent protease